MICITWDSIHCHPKTVAHEILTLCYYGLRDEEIRCLAPRCRPSATERMAAAS